MRHIYFLIVFLTGALFLEAQTIASFAGKVTDASGNDPLPGASISIYSGGNVSGLISNKDGRFVINNINHLDSLKVSMVGYHSAVIYEKDLPVKNNTEIKLTVAPVDLKEIVIRPPVVLEIIKKAAAKINALLPVEPFESKGFYREIIKDRENYFSVAEAVFRAQYFPAKEMYKLQLIRGRSKEDVSYTRLFEDFHQGGGPQSVAGNSFIISRPDFLNLKKINDFNYKIDSLVQFDDELLYRISFDQKPGVKEALEKGTLLIRQDNYAVVRFEAANSPLGNAYIKSLTGTDKVFAELLNIDFKRKSWKRRVDFTCVNNKWFMSYADAEHSISYKQPKKNLDLDLTINIELLMTDLQLPLKKEIDKAEEWKRKNIIASLPGVFDSAYWGNNNIISPTASVNAIVSAIVKTNNETDVANPVQGWRYVNRNFFVVSQHPDTIVLIPIMKCLWEDDEAGGMLYKEIEGDFVVETKINLVKNTNVADAPDKGFQQAGVIIRNDNDSTENYLLLSTGTGGNPNPKLFFKKTIGNKSKTVINKVAGMNGWLKMERKGKNITAWFKEEHAAEWQKAGEYEAGWLNAKLQLGLAVFARFAGDGPKMQPDMKAVFSDFKINQR